MEYFVDFRNLLSDSSRRQDCICLASLYQFAAPTGIHLISKGLCSRGQGRGKH